MKIEYQRKELDSGEHQQYPYTIFHILEALLDMLQNEVHLPESQYRKYVG